MTTILLVIDIILSSASLAWGYYAAGWTSLAIWLVIPGITWVVATWRRADWAASVELIFAVLAAGLGLLLGALPGWMLAGSFFALIAWDLTAFRERLSLASFEDDLAGIERRHLLRLSLLALAAMVLSSIALFANLKMSFEWILLLTIVTAVGITQFVRWLRNFK